MADGIKFIVFMGVCVPIGVLLAYLITFLMLGVLNAISQLYYRWAYNREIKKREEIERNLVKKFLGIP